MKRLPCLVMLLIALLSVDARAVDLRLGYIDRDLQPFLVGEGPEIPARPGMTIELLQRVLAHTGGNVQLVRMPLRRLIEEIRAGHKDGILGYRYDAERAVDLVYPMRGDQPDSARHALRLSYALYRKRGDAIGWDGSTISGLKGSVATTTSELMAQTLRSRGIEIVPLTSNAQIFGMLTLGRVDAVVTLEGVADRLLQQQNNTQIEKLLPPLVTADFYLPVSRQFYAAHRDFTERLWQAMGDLREPTYAALTPDYLF